MNIDLGLRRSFSWLFLIADVSHAILGADFLSQWGICEYVILRVQIETRWVARVLAGTFLSHMAGRSLPFQCFHSPVRFLFFFSFPSHGKSADLCS